MMRQLQVRTTLSVEQKALKDELEVLDTTIKPMEKTGEALTEGLQKRGYSVMGLPPDTGTCSQCGKPW